MFFSWKQQTTLSSINRREGLPSVNATLSNKRNRNLDPIFNLKVCLKKEVVVNIFSKT